MIVKHRLTADITRRGLIPRIDAVQNDKYCRDLEIRLQANGTAFTPPAGCSVLVRYQKSDGTGGVYDTMPDGSAAWGISNQILTVALAPQICTAAGPVQMAISLLQGTSEICCLTVQVDVQPLPGISKASEAYFNVTHFIPQPENAQAGQYLKVVSVDALGKVTAVGTGSVSGGGTEGTSSLEVAEAVALEYGAQPTVTELNSSTTAARQYRLGIPQGKPGDTPVRGTDYWTQADQKAILDEAKSYIAAQLADHSQVRAEYANSVDECSDTSGLYVLPDGYIYAYTASTGGASYTNLADPDSSDWLTDCRINSAGNIVAASGVLVTNFIEVSNASSIHLKGLNILNASSNGENYGRIYAYDADKNRITGTAQPSNKPELFPTADYDDTVTVVDIAGALAYWYKTHDVQYIRFGGFLTVDDAADAVITADEDIISSENGYAWQNTGHAFVPADYEDRIITLEEQAQVQTEQLEVLQSTLSSTPEIPDYWQDAVDAAVAKVEALQDAGGSDVVNFVWFSDMHYKPDNTYVHSIGTLCAAVMDTCNIPLALMCGDTMSAAVVDSEDTLLEWLDGAREVLSPIGFDRLIQIRGNHDDVYGRHTEGDTTTYYVNKVAPAKIWNRIHRHQANDFRKVFGGDGSYFYLDNVPQKIRFICLNSHFYDGSAITGGAENAMTNGFGSAQLSWLQNEALAMDEGWDVVIATHIPPAASAINGTVYQSQYSDADAFRSIIEAASANIIGIFCGHCHVDAAVTGDLPCPIVTVTCATNTPYDNTSADRVSGTDTETAIDIVSINRAAKTISMTRLGIGSDRELRYGE